MKEKLAEFLDVIMGFRKLIVMLLVFTISVSFRLKGYLNGDQFTDLLKAVVIAFFGANSVEHFTSMVEQHLENKSAPPPQDG